jgi:hypothetical protein
MASSAQLDLANIPNLPGYSLKRKKAANGRANALSTINGVRMISEEGVTFEKPKMCVINKVADTRRLGSCGHTTASESYQPVMEQTVTQMPAWDALDRHVLRFYGFFKESVVETNLENYRVRHCAILYYLEDDTCQIVEKRQENSGIPQGTLIRRHRFPGVDGGYLVWQDLAVGIQLNIYGRSIQVVDCDKWTRSYYADQGMDQEPGEPLEEDGFMSTFMNTKKVEALRERTYEGMYREAQLGGGNINADMQQFMEWDRKVCRYYAIMDDITTPQFERRPFIICLYLANDTLEVREQYPLNAGRDQWPLFFKRGRIKRGLSELNGPMDDAIRKEECLNCEDFRVGETTLVRGYNFYIYDADPFTRQYYRSELGIEMADPTDVRMPERAVPRPPTPPYTGYGTWEDSLGSVRMLCPKPPKKDFNKLFENSGLVLRFTAKFSEGKPEDADRMFIVAFYLEDDCMQIHEPPSRNSGIMTGRFLEKGIHTNQITGDLFKAADLYPGARICVYNRLFDIVDPDEYTRMYYQSEQKKRVFNLSAVLEKMRDTMKQKFPLVRDIFRKYDSDHDGVLTMVEFKEAILKMGFLVSDDEALVIMAHFDARKDGQISYNEFCDALLDEDSNPKVMHTKPRLNEQHDPEYAERAKSRLLERQETEKVRAAARALGNCIYMRQYNFIRACKELAHMTHEEEVSADQLQTALRQMGKVFDVEDVKRAVAYVMPGADLTRINYVQFFQALTTSFHDLSANR